MADDRLRVRIVPCDRRGRERAGNQGGIRVDGVFEYHAGCVCAAVRDGHGVFDDLARVGLVIAVISDDGGSHGRNDGRRGAHDCVRTQRGYNGDEK